LGRLPIISTLLENNYVWIFPQFFFEIEFGFFFGIGFAALVYWFGKKLGGQGSFKGVFSSLCYSSLPIAIVGVLVLLPLGIFGGRFLYDSDTLFSPFFVATILVGVASTIWGLVLSILAIMKSHQLGIGKSIGVGFLAAIVILVLALPILFLTELNSEIPSF